MKKVSGKYIKKSKAVHFSIEVPSKWDELNKKQFARIIEVLHFRKADRFTLAVSLLGLLFGPKNWHILHYLSESRPSVESDMSGDEFIHALIPLTNFLFEEQPPMINHFPVINLRGKKHLASLEDLSNLGFGEWCFAHQYFIYYKLTLDKHWLHKLIATIYRPSDPNQDPDRPDYSGDRREVFNENLIEKRALTVANIDWHILLGILTWFSCALIEITNARPHVFPEPPKLEEGQELPPIELDSNRTWMSVFRELLGPKWGTEDKLKFTNAMFVLDELEEKHIAFEEAKKQN